MKNLFNFISSMKLTATLLSVFAIAIAIATFIESDFSTQTAQAEVYSALWFQILLAVLGINLLSSMIKHSMFQVKKMEYCPFSYFIFSNLTGCVSDPLLWI